MEVEVRSDGAGPAEEGEDVEKELLKTSMRNSRRTRPGRAWGVLGYVAMCVLVLVIMFLPSRDLDEEKRSALEEEVDPLQEEVDPRLEEGDPLQALSEPPPKSKGTPTVSADSVHDLYVLDRLEFLGVVCRHVPVLVARDGVQYARVNDELILEAKTTDDKDSPRNGTAGTRDTWKRSGALTASEFGALVRRATLADGEVAVPIPKVLEMSGGYFSDATQRSLTKIAYIKTHKTGSTTLGGVIFRYGARHGLRFFTGPHIMTVSSGALRKDQIHAYDLCVRHHSPLGFWLGSDKSYTRLRTFYENIIAEPFIVTITREPVSQVISHFYFYLEPGRRPKGVALGDYDDLELLKEYVQSNEDWNGLASEFGISSEDLLVTFLDEELPNMGLMLLMDRLSESLVVLRHLLKVDLRDVTYRGSIYSRTDGSLQRGGNNYLVGANEEDLDEKTLARIREKTQWDARIYAKAESILDEKIRTLESNGVNVTDEAKTLEELNLRLDGECTRAQLEGEDTDAHIHRLCRWYKLRDVAYEAEADENGFAVPVPFIE